jgi:hypothetical protein
MLSTLWRLSRGYRLRPWKSPYLGWRIETYTGIPAEQLGFSDFWRQVWRFRKDIVRYARWAERMQDRQ